MKDPHKVWQTLTKFDYPLNLKSSFSYYIKILLLYGVNILVQCAAFHIHPIESYSQSHLGFHNHASLYALTHQEIIQNTAPCNYTPLQTDNLLHPIVLP